MDIFSNSNDSQKNNIGKQIKSIVDKFRGDVSSDHKVIYSPHVIKEKGASKEDLRTPIIIGVTDDGRDYIIDIYKNLLDFQCHEDTREKICSHDGYTQERVDIFISAHGNGIDERAFRELYIKTLSDICSIVCNRSDEVEKPEPEGAGD